MLSVGPLPPTPHTHNASARSHGPHELPGLRPVQSARRDFGQLRVPQVPVPVLRERGGLGAQGVGQCRGCLDPDQGAARSGRPRPTTAQLQAGQGLQRDRVVHAQSGARHPGVVDVRHHRVSGAELH